ncbi:MAG: zinc-ribbon domain-containing protein [Candidatus Odinarchaeota archaeon]|nr:zinc-ribbon domain-containing protein [Candidatus Odinarchaeota archaeon]
MPVYKYTGTLGFLLSTIMIALWFTLVGAMYNVLIYPISIILRTIAWISVARTFKKTFCYVTAFFVLVLGGLFFFLILGGLGEGGPSGSEVIRLAIMVWAAYSFFEFLTYFMLTKYTKVFFPAMVSIIGIAIILNGAFTTIDVFEELVSYIITGCVFLLISSLSAMISFLKLTPPEEAPFQFRYPPAPAQPAPPLMVCPSCGARIPMGSKFCPYCGARLTATY